MANVTDFPACGKVLAVRNDLLVFNPAGTNYELHLSPAGGTYQGPQDQPVEASIAVKARKIWTVPSGGNFITPLFGPPKIIQGHIEYLDNQQMVLHAGTSLTVDLPADAAAYDLANGPLTVGAMVNVTALPGAIFQLLEHATLR